MTSELADAPTLTGLLVAGGKSRRMGRDKAGLPSPDGPLWRRTWDILRSVCPDTCISIRPGQSLPGYLDGEALLLEDTLPDAGPLAGILAAFEARPECAWLVVACDLPLLDRATLEQLVHARQTGMLATSYRSNFDGKPEPLCAIYEPATAPLLKESLGGDHPCPRRFLMQNSARVSLLDLVQPFALENANTPEDLERIAALSPQQQP